MREVLYTKAGPLVARRALLQRQAPSLQVGPCGCQRRRLRCATASSAHADHVHDKAEGALSRRTALALAASGLAAAELGRGAALPRPARADEVAPGPGDSRPGVSGVPDAVVDSVKPRAPTEQVEIGRTGVKVTPIGIGAWSWGDRSGYWGYGSSYQREDNFSAYKALVESGVTFIDTAEVYGFGLSETFLGEFMAATGTRPVIATKYAPLPWRFSADTVVDACKASLGRLQIDQIGLYQIHWPGFVTNGWANDKFVEGLARVHQQGLAAAVGVSNFKAERVRSAAKILGDAGVPLASNQVQYSLLYREPERNGVAQAVREAGATLIAYSPLAQGLLTGKYTKDNLPGGPRSGTINEKRLQEIEPLLGLMREIGQGRGGKTPAQIAINWTLCKGALPIPGAKNAKQVQSAAGAYGWRMTADEVAALDAASDKIPTNTGAPFENW